jgi:hypothetical protein
MTKLSDHAIQVRAICKDILEKNGNQWMSFRNIVKNVNRKDLDLFTKNSHCYLRTGAEFERRQHTRYEQQYRVNRNNSFTLQPKKISKQCKTITRKRQKQSIEDESSDEEIEYIYYTKDDIIEELLQILVQNNNEWMTARQICSVSFPDEKSPHQSPIYNILCTRTTIFERKKDESTGRIHFRLTEQQMESLNAGDDCRNPTIDNFEDNIDEYCLVTTLDDLPTKETNRTLDSMTTTCTAKSKKELPEFAIVYPISDDECE